MGVGASFLGATPFLSVDRNELSCRHLRSGHGEVLQLDLTDPDSAKVIHWKFGEAPGTVTFGFPCQPHSSQGFGLGSKDDRFQVFFHGLKIIFLLQAQSAILECSSGGCTPSMRASSCLQPQCHGTCSPSTWTSKSSGLAVEHVGGRSSFPSPGTPMDCTLGQVLAPLRQWVMCFAVGALGLMLKKLTCSCMTSRCKHLPTWILGMTSESFSSMTLPTVFCTLTGMLSWPARAAAGQPHSAKVQCDNVDFEDVLFSPWCTTTLVTCTPNNLDFCWGCRTLWSMP